MRPPLQRFSYCTMEIYLRHALPRLALLQFGVNEPFRVLVPIDSEFL
jgi:hypothetical protein